MTQEERLGRAERKVRTSSNAVPPRGPDPSISGETVSKMPRTGEFVTGRDFLNLESLYPRQLTALKLIFLELDDLTDYDVGVISEWTSEFKLVEGHDGLRRFEGSYGLPPDILERAERCRAEGRPWFHDVIAPTGRRAGKGFLMSICCAGILWRLFCHPGGPHNLLPVLGIKRLNISVFAGKKDQAVGNLWRDIVELILNAPCFEPYVANKPRGDTLLLYSPSQLQDGRRPDPDRALIEIVARESTRVSGRGPASVALFFDEMAYMVPTGLTRSADEVYIGAEPANRQFGHYGFIGQVSSPWTKTDRFYDNYQSVLRVDDDGHSLHHESLVLQVPSWEMYRDWELTQ
jgi:hypothetical protein